MTTPTRPTAKEPRMDLWVLARKAAETLLHTYPETMKHVLGMVRSRALSGLCDLGKVEDHEYHGPDIEPILAQRQIAALFKKNAALVDEQTCQSAAERTFRRGEAICRVTNKRLDHFYVNRDRLDPELRVWLDRMESDILQLLGDFDTFRRSLTDRMRLTNGATEDRPRRRSYPFLKITGKLRGPRAAVPHIGKILLEMGVDLSSCKYECVERNVVVLVPKNWKTHRTIAKEPTHSLPLQLAADSYMKSRLRRWGIDLRDQSKNQEYARLGSIDGSLATVDLEMASDTLAFNSVAWLLPLEWFEFLRDIRSSCFSAPWGDGVYAKFSSMGNGATFSLETLIFAAACRAVGSRQYAVYGDDIVLETERAPSLFKLLKFLGFRVNEEKSFYNPDSRFRESCGADYFEGRFVTPFYLRELPKLADKAGVCHVINGLVQASWPGPLWDYLRNVVNHEKLRLVPWNEDSRSGIWIDASSAWRTKVLFTDRKRPKQPKPGAEDKVQCLSNPTYGFPVFRGYGPIQDTKSVKGWRSLLHWHINARSGGDAPNHLSRRTTAYLLQLNARRVGDFGDASNSVTQVVVRTRYVHKTCRYVPVDSCTTPLHIYPWVECLGVGAA